MPTFDVSYTFSGSGIARGIEADSAEEAAELLRRGEARAESIDDDKYHPDLMPSTVYQNGEIVHEA